MSDKPKSYQQRWQEKMIAEGRCRQCGSVNKNKKTRCDKCLKNVVDKRNAARYSKVS